MHDGEGRRWSWHERTEKWVRGQRSGAEKKTVMAAFSPPFLSSPCSCFRATIDRSSPRPLALPFVFPFALDLSFEIPEAPGEPPAGIVIVCRRNATRIPAKSLILNAESAGRDGDSFCFHGENSHCWKNLSFF